MRIAWAGRGAPPPVAFRSIFIFETVLPNQSANKRKRGLHRVAHGEKKYDHRPKRSKLECELSERPKSTRFQGVVGPESGSGSATRESARITSESRCSRNAASNRSTSDSESPEALE